MTRPHRSWHRDGIPAWGWLALVVMRVVSLAWALVPLALLAGGLWWWTHSGARHAPELARSAARHARAAADSVFGR